MDPVSSSAAAAAAPSGSRLVQRCSSACPGSNEGFFRGGISLKITNVNPHGGARGLLNE